MVMNQAMMMLPATPQRTAEARRAAPTPMMQPVIVCVVETGMPSQVAPNSMIEPPASAQTPSRGDRRHVEVQPPERRDDHDSERSGDDRAGREPEAGANT